MLKISIIVWTCSTPHAQYSKWLINNYIIIAASTPSSYITRDVQINYILVHIVLYYYNSYYYYYYY